MTQGKYEYDKIAQAIDFISSHVKQQPSLEEVAEKVHVSPFHFQRMFTEWAGVSPKKFLQFLTVDYAKQVLAATPSKTLSEAADEMGLSGSSRLHDLFVNIEGMTPGEYKNAGENLTIHFSIRECQFGDYMVASTGKGICNLFFFDGNDTAVRQELQNNWPKALIREGKDQDQEKVANFFRHDFNERDKIKLHLKGTQFQLKVWEALLKIPQGNLSTYGTIAQHIQKPSASRAVGTAIGSNPIAFLIPCHRVIQSIGGIGGFRWGTSRKKAMIGWEASHLSNIDV